MAELTLESAGFSAKPAGVAVVEMWMNGQSQYGFGTDNNLYVWLNKFSTWALKKARK